MNYAEQTPGSRPSEGRMQQRLAQCRQWVDDHDKAVLAAIVVATAIFLIVRSFGLYPTVLDDEYLYSRFSRLVPLREAYIPNFLYFLVFRVTNVCGEGFLDCARFLNVIFFVAAAPLIYALARQVTGKSVALTIVALSLLGPINTYTAYFMAESMYFFGFWAFTWFLLGSSRNTGIVRWALLGAGFGLLSLVKPHALFLLPAVAILLVVYLRQNAGRIDLKSMKSMKSMVPGAIFFSSAAAAKFGVGLILAGSAALVFFGSLYADPVLTKVPAVSRYFGLAIMAGENLGGHLMALCLLFSVPLAEILLPRKCTGQPCVGQDFSGNLKLYAAVALAILLAMTACFTASIASPGTYETNVRLHMRYYDFALPLLLITVAALSDDVPAVRSKWRVAVAVPIGAAILYALWTKLKPYTPYLPDSPEIHGALSNSVIFHALGGLSLMALIVWTFRPKTGRQIFLFLFMPLAVILSTLVANHELRQRQEPNVYDRAGVFFRQYLANQYLPADGYQKVLIVGPDASGLYRALFHLDNPDAAAYDMAKYFALSPAASFRLTRDKEWLMFVTNFLVPEENNFLIRAHGFTLMKLPASTVDFRKYSWPGVISGTSGLDNAMQWGRASVGDTVTLEFLLPLPEKLAVHLWGKGLGLCAGKEFTIQIGGRTQRFVMGDGIREQVFEFDNPERLKTVTIRLSSPLTPQEWAASRRHGEQIHDMIMLLTRIRIEPLAAR